ncbi:MAG TPA: hypothetical protein VFG62_08725 [Rhodopila sp.]|nr:hypothetical protein [Rhodopila sp.]
MKLRTMASTHSFAHLLGFGATKTAKKGSRAEEELDEEKGDGDDEGDEKKGAKRGNRAEEPEREEEEDESEEREEEEKGDAKKGKKAKGRRARAEDDDEGDDGESGDDDDEGDDDSDGADMRKGKARSARLRERARCAAIFADAAAANNPALAATLAFNTDMPRSQAVAVLRAGGSAAPKKPSLYERMSRENHPRVGASDPGKPAEANSLAARIVAAGKKRRGEL